MPMLRLFNLPNLLTLANLTSGCIGIIAALNGDLRLAGYLVILAGIFDFFDGFAARALKLDNPIGGDLDSLADAITFGVLPGIIFYQLLSEHYPPESSLYLIGKLLALVFPICAILRLAKFNVSTEQSYNFKGLATPAATLFVIALPFWSDYTMMYLGLCHQWVLYFFVFGLSLLMISDLDLLAFKFKNYSWADNSSKYIFLIIALLLFILLGVKSLTLIIPLYILFSFWYFKTESI